MAPNRKVQAQRKFAAPLLGHTTAVAVSVAGAATVSKTPEEKEKLNIITNSMQARNLLDIVAFQNMHIHKSRPVVLLERLENASSSAILRPNAMVLKTARLPRLPRARRRSGVKKHKAVGKTNRPRPVKKLRKKLPAKRLPSISDLEDEKPLKYFKTVSTGDQAEEANISDSDVSTLVLQPLGPPSSPISRYDNGQTTPLRYEDTSDVVVISPGPKLPIIISDDEVSRVTRSSSSQKHKGRRTTNNNSESDRLSDVSELVDVVSTARVHSQSSPRRKAPLSTNNNSESDQLSDVSELVDVVSTARVHPQSSPRRKAPLSKHDRGERHITTESDTVSRTKPFQKPRSPIFKEPALPATIRTTRSTGLGTMAQASFLPSTSKDPVNQSECDSESIAHSDISDWAIQSTSKEGVLGNDNHPSTSMDQHHDPIPISDRGVYVCSNGQFSWSPLNDSPPLRVPPTLPQLPTPMAPRAPSPCPSESMRTVRDVVTAAPSVLAKRCHKCCPCVRVQRSEKIIELLRSTPRLAEPDVYEFAEETDASQPIPMYLHRKQSRSEDEDEHIYLDLTKDSPQVIEITSVKVPNSKKRLLKARLIAKAEAQKSEDCLLIEQDCLLDQLLESLDVNSSKFDGRRQEDSHEEGQEGNRGLADRRSSSGSGKRRPDKDKTRTSKRAVGLPADKDAPRKSVGLMVEAPTYHPTEEEFTDPILFFEKIAPEAAKYGLCRVVAPANFKPKCVLNDEIKFKVFNHYIGRLFSRWGPATREMSVMRAHLAPQIAFQRVPLLESVEVNLPKLYNVVQRHGGLNQVIDKKRWGRVASEMGLSRGPNTEKMLDSFYVKYLLPYDTANNQERTQVMGVVETTWNKKYKKLLEWSRNPLHPQRKILGDSDSSDDEPQEDPIISKALHEAEDCVVEGRTMNLTGFKKVAANAKNMYIGSNNTTPEEIENEYWRLVLFGTEHVCVNAAAIDTGAAGYGFSKNKHPWNLKTLSSNSGNVLRSMSSVLGVTQPTLNLGMIFSTSCWHRDPHGLPWVEYMHEGDPKIWYGISDDQTDNFRHAVEKLCPTSCQNKDIWLSSDITMIPPTLLRENRVSLTHTIQNPGEFIIVFPKAYSSSIATGFTVSESVYFAPLSWLSTVHQVFQELRSSCEPTTFSLEQLLIAMAKDHRLTFGALHTVHSTLSTIVDDEKRLRKALVSKGLQFRKRAPTTQRANVVWNVRDQAECRICRRTLYLSKVTGFFSEKKSALCLMHAEHLIEKRKLSKSDIAKLEGVQFFTEKQLDDVMTHIQKRLLAAR